jgi:hypothetical protein
MGVGLNAYPSLSGGIGIGEEVEELKGVNGEIKSFNTPSRLL